MRSIRILHLVSVAAFIGLLGCAAIGVTQGGEGSTYPQPSKGDPQTIQLEDVTFRFNEKGNLVPISVNGKPFVKCGEKGEPECKIYREGITVLDIENIDITVIKHKRSPECVYVQSRRGAKGALVGAVESEACL